MIHNIFRKVALLALGVLVAGSANALGFGAKVLADNEISSWQLINHDTSSIVTSGSTPMAQLGTPDDLSFSGLNAGEYSLVFELTNWTSIFDKSPGPANTHPSKWVGSIHPGNWVGFLASLSPDAGTAMDGLNGNNPLVSDASWDSNLGDAIPSVTEAIATAGSAGWSDTSEVIASNGDGIWGDRPQYGWTGFSGATNWIWAADDTDGQVLLRTQFQLTGVQLEPVPIPAAGVLFFSAIAGLLTMGRRRKAPSEA